MYAIHFNISLYLFSSLGKACKSEKLPSDEDDADPKISNTEAEKVTIKKDKNSNKKDKKAKKQDEHFENEYIDDSQTEISGNIGNDESKPTVDNITENVVQLDIDHSNSDLKTDVEEKKLTHKEKKKLKKQQEYEKQLENMLKKGGQGHSELESNFTVSQTQKTSGQLAALENAVDIKIENFSIAAKGKDLFVNANLLIANGRHYGLVGPNG